ncbi:semaphorin-7A isoform X2 [Lampris incognitus]|uniref:semaphorin-7A isoform X2 n=1 Tax=Lampris incognitus TaxID=2546036 RepID=UPI0024B61527|nr:semaphorin-7A isoform X2 [Lampris incognitus]
MSWLVGVSICLAWDFQFALSSGASDAPSLGLTNTPRRVLSPDRICGRLEYPVYQNHTVFFHRDGSDELYVGGTDYVLKINVDDNQVIEGLCYNVVTVIQEFQDSLFVCGTNGYKPKCWKLYSRVHNQSREIVESYEGTGISPFAYTQNSLSLTADGDLYTAAPLGSDGRSLQFRRKAGGRANLWMYDNWVSEPTFVAASWVERKEDPENDKIYVFFREKNSDSSPEADPWVSSVARVCKVDEGGSKRFFQNIWTTFLKARLVCGFPKESLYFNHLQDVYVVQAEDWHNTSVYALFTSSWNSTAVCIYSMAKIDEIFESSTFKGYQKDIPNPRPGTCVKNSRSLPLATVLVIKDHPEMKDWIHSVHHLNPFYISNNNYTKIAVDRVQAADQRIYNILFLATDSGKIHKVLESDSEAFIISETHLSNHSAIHSMRLDTKKKKLIVGFSEQIVSLDLQKCQEYNSSCEECVLARDPYCAWTESGCTSNTSGGIQNISGGETNVCRQTVEGPKSLNRTKRETPSPSPLSSRAVHSVPLDIPFYLSCPIDSYHAAYTWEHNGRSSPCLQMQSSCLHLIPAMAQESYGTYRCVSTERDYTKVVKEYQLTRQPIGEPIRNSSREVIVNKTNDAAVLAPQMVGVIVIMIILI